VSATPHHLILARAVAAYPGTTSAQMRVTWLGEEEPTEADLAKYRDAAAEGYRRFMGEEPARVKAVVLPYDQNDQEHDDAD
jgi:hypothetical protein